MDQQLKIDWSREQSQRLFKVTSIEELEAQGGLRQVRLTMEEGEPYEGLAGRLDGARASLLPGSWTPEPLKVLLAETQQNNGIVTVLATVED